jgi:hypothetical protein
MKNVLKQAYSYLSKEQIQAFLPNPYKVHIDSHDTGFQADICAQAEGQPRLMVWRCSIWYSSVYSFNDKDKVMGIQPECEFAQPVVDEFMGKLKAFVEAQEKAAEVAKERKALDAEAKRKETIAYYASQQEAKSHAH